MKLRMDNIIGRIAVKNSKHAQRKTNPFLDH